MNETISCETTHVGLVSNSSLSLLYVCLTKSNLVSYHFQHSTNECCQNKMKHCSNTRV